MKKALVAFLVKVFIDDSEKGFYARALCPTRLRNWLYFEEFGELPWQTFVMSR